MSKAENEFKPKTTAEKIEVMQAYERGEEIERTCFWTRGKEPLYHTCNNPNWDWVDCDYRVKPKPVTKTLYFAVLEKNGNFKTSPFFESTATRDWYCIDAMDTGYNTVEQYTLEV
jgi:hypothetical protein